MTATLTATANDILNRVAAEVGVEPVADPWGSNEENFTKMRFLINIAGEELAQLYPWEFLVAEEQITTSSADSGNYPFPTDFLYILNQTGWERAENVPLFGPLSAQDWTYLLGRDLVTSTIYASFRIKDGQFSIFPQPPPDGLDINYEYISRNWVRDTSLAPADEIKNGGDTPLYDRTLLSRMLKVKWLEAKGFDSTKAQDDFNQIFQMLTSHDKGADILSAGKNRRYFPYLDGFRNTPDSGFGSL